VIGLVVLAATVVLLEILLLSNTTGTSASTNIVPDNEISDSIDEAYNSSASATIMITCTTAPDKYVGYVVQF